MERASPLFGHGPADDQLAVPLSVVPIADVAAIQADDHPSIREAPGTLLRVDPVQDEIKCETACVAEQSRASAYLSWNQKIYQLYDGFIIGTLYVVARPENRHHKIPSMISIDLNRRAKPYRSRIDCCTRRAVMDLYRVDLSFELDLLKIEQSKLDKNAKCARKAMIVIEHHEKRRPYLDVLNERWAIRCRQSSDAGPIVPDQSSHR
jgi:hypothetical protein